MVAKALKKFLDEVHVEHRLVALYAPRQNGLVERFMDVLKHKLLEADEYGWNYENTVNSLLLDYRCTPHCTTLISPYEAMFNRKMQTAETRRFYPEVKAEGERELAVIPRPNVEKKIEKMKEYHDNRRGCAAPKVNVGDYVKIKQNDGSYGGYEKVIAVGNNSVTLSDGRKWPMNRVSQRVRKGPER